jgi:hypothetical protein
MTETSNLAQVSEPSKRVPAYVARQYVGGAHGFRMTKRAQLKTLIKAYAELRVGSAFFPGGTEPLEKIDEQLKALEQSLSVKNWGR